MSCSRKNLAIFAEGSFDQLPGRSTSPILLRNLDMLCGLYVEASKAFKMGAEPLKQLANQHFDLFKQDGCVGLLKQLIAMLVKSDIKRLTNTYVTLSLEQIASSVQIKDVNVVKHFVMQMIANGEVAARINGKDGNVSFLENQQTYDDVQIANTLHEKITQIMKLSGEVSSLDREVSVDTNYLERTTVQKSGKGDNDAIMAMSNMRGMMGMHGMHGMGGMDEDAALKMALEQSQHDQ